MRVKHARFWTAFFQIPNRTCMSGRCRLGSKRHIGDNAPQGSPTVRPIRGELNSSIRAPFCVWQKKAAPTSMPMRVSEAPKLQQTGSLEKGGPVAMSRWITQEVFVLIAAFLLPLLGWHGRKTPPQHISPGHRQHSQSSALPKTTHIRYCRILAISYTLKIQGCSLSRVDLHPHK